MERIIEEIKPLVPLQPKAKRVAAYARVSTEKDAMHHSLSAQISYYNDYIQSHSGWVYCGVYSDEAVTGTKSFRVGFQKLLRECRRGNIDLIVTKSISRFARNTVDFLRAVRELKDIGVDIFFEEHNLHSVSPEGEFILTVLASYAQEESLSASENIKWRIRKSFEAGELLCMSFLYGFEVKGKELVINPKEAEIVREIFQRIIDGDSLNSVATDLNQRNIPCKRGGVWDSMRIGDIVRNEKYAGNSLLQKSYINNHLEKKKLKNNGELPMYFAEGTHEGIVDKKTFDQAQIVMKNMAEKYKKSSYTIKPFQSLIHCEKCGKNYRRMVQNGKHAWNCTTFLSKGKSFCQEPRIPEDLLYKITAEVMGLKPLRDEDIKEQLLGINAYDYTLTFYFKDGTIKTTEWEPPSRAKSWTPEMKNAARQRALLQRRK